MRTLKVVNPEQQPRWLQARHQEWHANRPKAWDIKVEGCQECLLELIWKQKREIILGVSRFHDQLHPNILKNEYHMATHAIGPNEKIFGWFKSCSHCIDIIFIAWTVNGKRSKAS